MNVYDVATGKLRRTLTVGPFSTLGITLDGARVAVGRTGHPIRILRIADGKELLSLPWQLTPGGDLERLQFSPDGKYLAVSVWGDKVGLIRLSDQKRVGTYGGGGSYHPAPIVAFSDDSKLIAIAFTERGIEVYQVPGSK